MDFYLKSNNLGVLPQYTSTLRALGTYTMESFILYS